MTSLVDGARKLVSRGSDIGARIEGLDAAERAARGRLDDAVVDDVRAIVNRASARLRLSADHTVVAIAGATGSGKSSTFNALAGIDLAAVGVRRPTTSWATACVWGQDGAEDLLEWLEIPPRHQVMRDSMLDSGRADDALRGVVLLDLPDHDSTEVSHHLEVDRLVQLADLMVWVLDPQKYADAALHDRYLKRFATHKDVTLVALNHIDTIPDAGRRAMLDDLRRLLDADGLDGVPLVATSARTGAGIPELRAEIVRRVDAKKSSRARLEADVKAAAARLEQESGTAKARVLSPERVVALDDALADAAGVPILVSAVERSTRMRANRATGWPLVAWFSRLRPDPLKRLHLDLGSAGRHLTGRSRTSVPEPTQVQRARVDTEVRALAEDVSVDLARPWGHAVRSASVSRLDDLGDRLDSALGATDLGVARIPVWAGVVRALQWLLITSALVGAAWLGVLAAMTYLRTPEPDVPTLAGFPIPTVMLIGGVLVGVLLALICRGLVSWTARRRAAAADRRLRGAIRQVSAELVVDPVERELEAYSAVRAGLAQATK